LKPAANHPGVVFSKDFTGQGTTADNYGHGTHVATMVAGADTFVSGDYTGIAPGASLLNLRVLDDNGQGSASNIIAAIDWCVTNKATYNIRVINMSLGGVAKNSYLSDPLCLAVRRAYSAGIIVVCAAGNDGKSATGQKYYGGIHTPGIDPSVITVGASNTFDTQGRWDDTVTTFSSRGPTRGYYVDGAGLKHFDNLIKPDLVAPGNKLIGACSTASIPRATGLIKKYPSLNPGTTSVAANQLLRMSGSSMSTGVVTGTVALLLQAQPTLTPNLVKAILMYTAQPLAGANNFEQGAGQLNIDGAVRVAKLVKSKPGSLANGAAMLTGSLPSPQTSTIFGTTFPWSQGVITDYCFLYGNNLMTKWQGAYAQGVLLTDATGVSNGTLTQNPSLVSTGVSNSQGSLLSFGLPLSLGVLVSDGVLLSNGVLLTDGVLIGDGVLVSDGVLISDGVLVSDFDPNGDSTTGMAYIPPR
jgi:serine protease AprX